MTDYSELFVAIYKHGCYRQEGRRAIDALVEGGGSALDAILIARNEPPASELHPRDLSDTVSAVFAGFANRMPDLLIEKYESDEINEFETLWALGSANGDRSVDTLIAGLKSKDKYSRWAAVESLVRHRSNAIAPALIEALKDRSSLVKSGVVFAMKSKKQIRRPEAIPALQRIIANKHTQKHSPGLLQAAQTVILMIEREAQ